MFVIFFNIVKYRLKVCKIIYSMSVSWCYFTWNYSETLVSWNLQPLHTQRLPTWEGTPFGRYMYVMMQLCTIHEYHVRVYYGAVTFRNSLKLLANIFSRNNSINLKTFCTQNSIKPHISSLGTSRIMNIGDIYTLWYNWWFIHGGEITLATENSFVSVATFFMKKHTQNVSPRSVHVCGP